MLIETVSLTDLYETVAIRTYQTLGSIIYNWRAIKARHALQHMSRIIPS